jgi:hypothetical protein
MIAYIQKIAEDLKDRFEFPSKLEQPERYGRAAVLAVDSIHDRLITLGEELERLDPRDFVADARYEFVEVRRLIRGMTRGNPVAWETAFGLQQSNYEYLTEWNNQIAQLNQTGEASNQAQIDNLTRRIHAAAQATQTTDESFREAAEICKRVADVLASYAGQGSQAVTRSFAFVRNADLRQIVERDYKELSRILFPDGAWKSTVVMAGSILEAILYDLLTHDPARIAAAMGSGEAPRKRGGMVKDLLADTFEDEWKLKNLIDVAVDLGLLPQESKDNIHQVLRDYRNFVHPRVEMQSPHVCTEALGLLAKGALDAICDHLQSSGGTTTVGGAHTTGS